MGPTISASCGHQEPTTLNMILSLRTTQHHRASILSAMLREPNEEKAPKTTGPKRPAACFGSHLYQKNDLLKVVLRGLTRQSSAYSFFQYLAKRFVAAHRATARIREPAPPSTKHTLHPCPLSLMEPHFTCDELGPFRAAQRSRRDSTSRRGVKLEGCAAG